MKSGLLVSDDILHKVIKDELKSAEENVILDGYPRNIKQAQSLGELKGRFPVKIAIHIDVDRQLLIKRLGGRRSCLNCNSVYHIIDYPSQDEKICDNCGGSLVQRSDDHLDKINIRLSTYESETIPVLEYYKELDLYTRIEGNKSPNTVFSQIEQVLRK